MKDSFMGYPRPDGSVGVRNHTAVIPSVSCANGVVGLIADRVAGVVPLYHGHGCCRAGRDLELHFRVLSNLGKHPNVSNVLVVGLGCEVIKGEHIASSIAQSGRTVELVEIQGEGGSLKAADKGSALAAELLEKTGQETRTGFGIENLVLGLECGGSDAFSGITANPAVGWVADWIATRGGTVIMTENTEMIGTSHILERRARSPEVGRRIRRMISDAHARAKRLLGPLASMVIAPGNIDGGVSSIQEKSLGCIVKGGTTSINEVVDYGETPAEKGLVVMDGPGYDTESVAGLASAGAQSILFTTGRGNPIGFPLVPVIKVASNSRMFEKMSDDMDVNAGGVLDGKSLVETGEEILSLLERVLGGEPVKAERNRQGGILCLYSEGPSF